MDQKDEVKSKVDIIEVISSYIPLKKAGRNFAGLCPFHSEKTPSFMVSGERQVFKCFGCGEAGDVFTFLEKIEGWDFREALEELAKRAGVKLKRFEHFGQSRVREKLIEINKLAAKFYAHLLNKHPIGEVARKYLAKRGIPKASWEKFELGFAPDSWDKTLEFLRKHGFGVEDVSQSGLIIARPKQGYYDRFRNRLMFPLKDWRGTILGFAGRVIQQETGNSKQETRNEAPLRHQLRQGYAGREGSEGQAKYINSPETPIFNKGSILFGLDLARAEIRKKNEAILVEGEFDVISAYGAGVLNTVASKGTALTDKQVATLSRICENVTLCFDTDLAGDVAARRGIELLDISGMTVKVASFGKYKDPDEFARSNAAGFKKAIGNASNVYDYLMASALRRFDFSSASGKKAIGREILPILAKISDDMVRAHYIEKLARSLDLDVALVAEAVSKRVGSAREKDVFLPTTDKKSSPAVLEQYFLALLLAGDKVPTKIDKFLSSYDFLDEACAAFWAWLHDIMMPRAKGNKEDKWTRALSIGKSLTRLPKNLNKLVDELYLSNISPIFTDGEMWAAEIVKIAERIKKESLRRQLVKISGRIKEAEGKTDEKQISTLYRKFDEISKNMKEVVLRW